MIPHVLSVIYGTGALLLVSAAYAIDFRASVLIWDQQETFLSAVFFLSAAYIMGTVMISTGDLSDRIIKLISRAVLRVFTLADIRTGLKVLFTGSDKPTTRTDIPVPPRVDFGEPKQLDEHTYARQMIEILDTTLVSMNALLGLCILLTVIFFTEVKIIFAVFALIAYALVTLLKRAEQQHKRRLFPQRGGIKQQT